MQDDCYIWGVDFKLFCCFVGLFVKEVVDFYGIREYFINKYESFFKLVLIYYDVWGLIFNCFYVIRKKIKFEGIKGLQVQVNFFVF